MCKSECHVISRAPHVWMFPLWPPSTLGDFSEKIPLDLKYHRSLHLGYTLLEWVSSLFTTPCPLFALALCPGILSRLACPSLSLLSSLPPTLHWGRGERCTPGCIQLRLCIRKSPDWRRGMDPLL